MRDNIGKNFTLKEVKFNFRKVCMEFWKRIDPNLPYFYHTSSHHRFSEENFTDTIFLFCIATCTGSSASLQCFPHNIPYGTPFISNFASKSDCPRINRVFWLTKYVDRNFMSLSRELTHFLKSDLGFRGTSGPNTFKGNGMSKSRN